ncbi:divalent metal cation transporter [Sphingomonas sp. PAMC26645]|uniref:NRAMP family divalent metal transporter n=1 Tax=Sphingomonas sp. PAMC26645 TaxID=2565555 RepID=UPI00109D9CB6|nr:divalent metal cation transporter [Sphingomonas sp. PAMC26645]QCB43308.1 divalent metal cation transporter [Sphingomonas sp. PAMC26645]
MKPGMKFRSIALFRQLGPGLVTGAADDDPSGIATYSQAGAQFGFQLLWTMVLTYPLMVAIQLVAARIGRVTGNGLARNMREIMPRWLVIALVGILFVANTINIGADIAAMGDAAELMVGSGGHAFTIMFAVGSLLLQLFVPYRRYSSLLKWLTLVLLSYLAVLLTVKIDWVAALHGLVVPTIPSKTAVVTIVAIFGTTISPYLFFWQSAQEVEAINNDPDQTCLRDSPQYAKAQFSRLRIDTLAGMAISNVVAIAIVIGTATTLNQGSGTQIDSAADAAKALAPVAGRFASVIFSLGIIGTGLLAVPVLAGSTGYAVGEAHGWKTGLENKPLQAIGFYSVIAVSTLLGIGIDWSPLDPFKALFWSAVLNGVAAVPLMAAMMMVVTRRQLMGGFIAGRSLFALGWTATAVMGVAAVAIALA